MTYDEVINCILNNAPGISTKEMAKQYLSEIEAGGKGEEIRDFLFEKKYIN